MSSVDLHPEDLLDRVRHGEASREDRERLHTHLAGCAACRFEHVLAVDCARASSAGSSSEDAAVLARVRRGAARATLARGGAGRSTWGRRRSTPLVYAAAAAFVFAATVAAATTLVRRFRAPEVTPVEEAPPAKRHVASLSSASRAETPVVAPPVAVDDSADDALAQDALGKDDALAAPVPTPRATHARHVASAESPGDLFARANAARRRGATREAARLYRELEREFPGSSEELVSRVTLGRWLLDRLDDPAGALRRFDSYLANPVHTALREEALIGRALALGRLGREAEERGAWSAFLAAFPGSVYAERARGRLAVLQ